MARLSDAGVQNPIEDLDLVELHDAFTISDLQTYGTLDSGLMVKSRITSSREMRTISIPILKNREVPGQPLGWLIGTMHAVGATGIFQAAECLWQLQQKYDKFTVIQDLEEMGEEETKGWQSLQIPEASKQALWVSMQVSAPM